MVLAVNDAHRSVIWSRSQKMAITERCRRAAAIVPMKHAPTAGHLASIQSVKAVMPLRQ